MKCEKCNTEHEGFYGAGRFCSRECARSFSTSKNRKEINEKVSNSLTGRTSGKWNGYIIPLEARKMGGKKLGEMRRTVRAKWVENWLKELISPPVHKKNHMKRVLFSLRGAKCENCGWDQLNPVSNTCPVELDHIDGNRNNNFISNLRLLCPNCHSLTPTYGVHNRNKSTPI